MSDNRARNVSKFSVTTIILAHDLISPASSACAGPSRLRNPPLQNNGPSRPVAKYIGLQVIASRDLDHMDSSGGGGTLMYRIFGDRSRTYQIQR